MAAFGLIVSGAATDNVRASPRVPAVLRRLLWISNRPAAERSDAKRGLLAPSAHRDLLLACKGKKFREPGMRAVPEREEYEHMHNRAQECTAIHMNLMSPHGRLVKIKRCLYSQFCP